VGYELEVTDMSSSSDDLEVMVERAAGLDVHKDMVAACVRVPDGAGGWSNTSPVRNLHRGPLGAAELAGGPRCEPCGDGSDRVYWKPVFYVLEEAVECWC
jgi:transposase